MLACLHTLEKFQMVFTYLFTWNLLYIFEKGEDGPVTMINVGLLHHDVFVSRAFLHSHLNDSAKKISNLPTNESLGPSQKSEEHYSGLQK